MHSDTRPARQYSQTPHLGDWPGTTRSPTAQPVTPAPSAATVPENSWPSITPDRPPHSTRKCRSEPQTPQWETSISSSPGPGFGVGRSSTATSRRPMNTAAGMTSGTSVIAMPPESPKPDTGVNLPKTNQSDCALRYAYDTPAPNQIVQFSTR